MIECAKSPASEIPKTTKTSFADQLEALIPEMRAYAQSLCRDVTLGDDLVQDACMRAWDKRHTFDPSQPIRPWLFRIVRNRFFEISRRSWRTVDVEASSLEPDLVEHTNFAAKIDLSLASQAILSLPDKQRDAFILVVVAGLTYDEAGEVLGVPGGTVKSRVSRARTSVLADLARLERKGSSGFTKPQTGPCPLSIVQETATLLRTQQPVAA